MFLRVCQIVAEHATIYIYTISFFLFTAQFYLALSNWANDCGLRFEIETESASIESKMKLKPKNVFYVKGKNQNMNLHK